MAPTRSYMYSEYSRRAFLAALAAAPLGAQAPSAAPGLSDPDIEKFLLEADVEKTRDAGQGVTNSLRATLFDGLLRHDAHVQTVNEELQFKTADGPEDGGRDAWQYNVAGYKMDRLLGLNMTPVSVERKWRNRRAAFTWWLDHIVMDERRRIRDRIVPPDVDRWSRQMYVVRVFDQLIANTDRNTQNLLLDEDWNVWMIDHTRAFRPERRLLDARMVTKCDRALLASMRELDRGRVKEALADYLTNAEIDSLMARRDLIVEELDKRVAKQGEAEVLFNRPPR